MPSEDEDIDKQVVALTIGRQQSQRCIGAAVYRRLLRSGYDDETYFSIDLYEFLDNDQLSNLDAFLLKIGSCLLYLPDEYEQDVGKADGKKIHNILLGQEDIIEVVYMKKSLFHPKPDTADKLLKLVGKKTHSLNAAASQRQLGYSCLECIFQALQVMDKDEYFGKYEIRLCNLSNYMRLDSAAADAINLLPKADHPSQFGSIYSVLNRCKTKMGSRLLERLEE